MSVEVVNKLIMVADHPNDKSGRVYPREELVKLVEKFKNVDVIGSFVGVDITDKHKVAITSKNFRMIGNALICDFTIMDTPNGFTLQNMIHNHQLALTPRGRGNVDLKTGRISNFDLISIDVKLV